MQWYTIETGHFLVHFHEGAERSAKVTAKVAEEVFEPVTALYDYKPDGKIQFVIRDHDDFSNGAAYYYDNKITIWASSLDFELRGSHNWLRNVVTHEFTHIIQLQAARKFSRKVPAFYLQGIGYEDETRAEDLYGFPNSIVSYPIALTVMPSWFAEGVAQFQIPGLGYDSWDAHRDMMLRTAVLEDKMLSFNAMSSFGKNSIGNERAYNQGFALSAYMAENYSLESLVRATKAMRSFFRVSFSGAIKKATGKSGKEIYREWQAHLKEKYAFRTGEIRQNLVAGELFHQKGIGNFYPQWSQDGSEIAFLTSGSSDFLSRTSLVIKNVATGEMRWVKGGVQTAFDRTPDGKSFVYAKKTDPNRHLSYFYDLYTYDLDSKKETRLTKNARAHSPAFSPDGRQIAFVVNGDGTQNLVTMCLDDKKIIMRTHYENGEQVFSPQWSPDGKQILFSFTERAGRQLLLLDMETGQVETIETGANDSRDAIFSEDGKAIYFSSDRTGIFNICRKDLQTGEITQLTNVLGGAFMPSVNATGEVAFATFVAEGYKIATLKRPKAILDIYTSYPAYSENIKLAANTNGAANINLNNIRAHEYNDKNLPDFKSRPYKNTYGSLSFYPVIRRDYGTTKVGTYLGSNDVLSGYNIFGGFMINRDLDYDLFALIEYRKLGPRLFLEGYNQVLHSSEGEDDFRYNLAQINAGYEIHLPY
ncbi:MAG: TolB family protein, partial [bacterium]